MFWKKKTGDNAILDLSEIEDQRSAFRYVFHAQERLLMTFKDQEVRIHDISAGGLAFDNKGFSKYEVAMVDLRLEMPNFIGDPVLRAQVRILHTSPNLCHSIFENCTVKEYEMVHKYVLEMQKRRIRSR